MYTETYVITAEIQSREDLPEAKVRSASNKCWISEARAAWRYPTKVRFEPRFEPNNLFLISHLTLILTTLKIVS